MTGKHRRSFFVDQTEYPFADHWFERDGAAMHFVDEGDGLPMVMLHGNPTWSFLYRNVIRDLEGDCRAIAPDYPGFGFSDHPDGYGYTPKEHARWVEALLDHLNVDRFGLVVQDWGGPIGLSLSVDRPEAVVGIVLCNTWCWPPMPNARVFSWIMGGPLGRYLHLRHNFFARAMIPAGIFNPRAKSAEVRKAYTAPFPTPASRLGTYVFPRQIRKASGWLRGIESRLSVLADTPVEMVWALRDPAFGKPNYLERWHAHFPGAPVDRVPHASHYLQEDAPERVAAAVRRLLKRVDGGRGGPAGPGPRGRATTQNPVPRPAQANGNDPLSWRNP